MTENDFVSCLERNSITFVTLSILHHLHQTFFIIYLYKYIYVYIYIFFPTVQHGDPVTHTGIPSFCSHYMFHHK